MRVLVDLQVTDIQEFYKGKNYNTYSPLSLSSLK